MRARVAVFVDGYFWHGWPIHGSIPTLNRQFLEDKIKGNVLRDRKVKEELKMLGWKVLRYLEHQIDEELEIVINAIFLKVKQ